MIHSYCAGVALALRRRRGARIRAFGMPGVQPAAPGRWGGSAGRRSGRGCARQSRADRARQQRGRHGVPDRSGARGFPQGSRGSAVERDRQAGAPPLFEALAGKGARRADAVRSRWRSTQAPATAVDRAAARGARCMAKGGAPRRTACRRPDRRRVAPRRSRPMAAPQDTARQAVSDSQTIVAPRASHASRNGAYRASTRLRRTLNVGVTKPLVSFQTESTTTTKRSFS
ncbi:hypothetical protein DP42_1997 [Burkholderia pseudomallei]|nr:hypothetical protein DP42_1997 [Burkholderia pseudomallei]